MPGAGTGSTDGPQRERTITDQYAEQDRRTSHDDHTLQPYACIQTGGGERLIYDLENPTAWIQSDTTNALSRAHNLHHV
ncbi:DUF7331 family protein [Natronomonas salsuginis]